MDSVSFVDQLGPVERKELLERLRTTEGWVREYCRTLGKRTPPKVKIAMKFTAYSPLTNVIAIPPRILMEVDERLLKIAVAHECGHFNRRWPSLFSWTTMARLKEEVLADRIAIALTGATLDDWAKCHQEVAVRETNNPDNEVPGWRRQVLSNWLNKNLVTC